MAISWPGLAETMRESALIAVESARESATKARGVGDPLRREFIAECGDMLAQAALAVRAGRLVRLGHADRWSPGVKARAELADGSLDLARAKLAQVGGDDPALDGARLAEVVALCSDILWYLTAR